MDNNVVRIMNGDFLWFGFETLTLLSVAVDGVRDDQVIGEIRCLLPTSRRQALILRTASGLVERDGHAPLLLKHGVKLIFKLLGDAPELGSAIKLVVSPGSLRMS